MDPLDELYDQIAAGEAEPPRAYDQYKRMLARARRAARQGDRDARAAAVTVTAAIGGHWALGVLREFSQDADPDIRAKVLDAAVAQGEDGLTLLRELLVDPAPELALRALEFLQQAVDRGSASRLRQLLRHDDPRLRAGAATLLGHTAGPGLIVPLRHAREAEEDEAVQAAIGEAIDRIDGNLPRAEPQPWWLDEDGTWAPAEAAPLPEALPTEPAALLALLGTVAEADQAPLVAALEEAGEAALRGLVRSTRVGGPADSSVGLCVASRRLQRRDWAVPIRRLLIDNNPAVRVAASEALAEIGPPAVAMNLRDLLSDSEPAVRLAALKALRAVVPLEEARRYTYPLQGEADPTVLAELEDMARDQGAESS